MPLALKIYSCTSDVCSCLRLPGTVLLPCNSSILYVGEIVLSPLSANWKENLFGCPISASVQVTATMTSPSLLATSMLFCPGPGSVQPPIGGRPLSMKGGWSSCANVICTGIDKNDAATTSNDIDIGRLITLIITRI